MNSFPRTTPCAVDSVTVQREMVPPNIPVSTGKARVRSQIVWAWNLMPTLPFCLHTLLVIRRPFDSLHCIFQPSAHQPSRFCLDHFAPPKQSWNSYPVRAAGNAILAHHTVFAPGVRARLQDRMFLPHPVDEALEEGARARGADTALRCGQWEPCGRGLASCSGTALNAGLAFQELMPAY